MTQREIEPGKNDTGSDWPASPWLRALLGVTLAAVLLAAHALPHLVASLATA